MGYSIKATIACNGACANCYEGAARESAIFSPVYNFKAIVSALDRIISDERAEMKAASREKPISDPPVLHGGEPMIIKSSEFEALLRRIHSFWGRTNIQTNGTLIEAGHFPLFRKYATHVGVSLDGDEPELNAGRWNAGKPDARRCERMTVLVAANVRALRRERVETSLMSVLWTHNASAERLPRFIAFLRRMRDAGIADFRFHCGVAHGRGPREDELSPGQMGEALCRLADWSWENPALGVRPVGDFTDLVLGITDKTCIFNGCDPFLSRAERVIMADGSIGTCLRAPSAIEGLQTLEADARDAVRPDILRATPYDCGGCADCEWWHACLGGCPGEGLEDDWRNRTRWCAAYIMAFRYAKRRIKTILPNVRTADEFAPLPASPRACLASLIKPVRPSAFERCAQVAINEAIAAITAPPPTDGSHGDAHGNEHGDKPHGDHGDDSLGVRP